MATTSNKKMIRIRLKAYDHQLIDQGGGEDRRNREAH